MQGVKLKQFVGGQAIESEFAEVSVAGSSILLNQCLHYKALYEKRGEAIPQDLLDQISEHTKVIEQHQEGLQK